MSDSGTGSDVDIYVPPAPDGLNDDAVAFWEHVHGATPISDYERTILAKLCRALTRVDELEDALKRDGDFLIPGSHGSTVINPLLPEMRQQLTTINTLYRTLKLHDVIGELPNAKNEPAVDPNVVDLIARAKNKRASGS
ncbi:hypothetical protein [Lentzea atacamensis]|uniref:hypothetical protein n=1 Tax=Lentzea atacamensis TaxID=531938 RepID=UPI0011BE22FF|nr:hypothetical protein [Lentzea atacamensis]